MTRRFVLAIATSFVSSSLGLAQNFAVAQEQLSAEVYRPSGSSAVNPAETFGSPHRRADLTHPAAIQEANRPNAAETSATSEPSGRTLAPPGTGANGSGMTQGRASPSMFTSMAGSLGVVLAAFGGLAWFLRKSNPSRGGHLAANVFEILGRKTLAPRQQAMLVRCGDRILLINLGSHGATTLAEFTDPAEVQRLTQACLSREASAFQESLQQIERKPVSGGFATVNSLFG